MQTSSLAALVTGDRTGSAEIESSIPSCPLFYSLASSELAWRASPRWTKVYKMLYPSLSSRLHEQCLRGRVKICIYSDQHSWSLSSLCAATRRLERGRKRKCAKEDFLFSWQSENSAVGALYYRKKYSSTPWNHHQWQRLPLFAALILMRLLIFFFFFYFSGSLCAGSGRVFISCDLGFEQNTVLGVAKHTITWWGVGFDHYLGSGIYKNLGMGWGIGNETVFRTEMTQVWDAGLSWKRSRNVRSGPPLETLSAEERFEATKSKV